MENPLQHPDRKNYERGEIEVKYLTRFVVGLSVSIVIAMILMYWLFIFFTNRRSTQDAKDLTGLAFAQSRNMDIQFPGPRLQVSARLDLQKLKSHEENILHRYAWIDRKSGIAQIPIERAMELMIQKNQANKVTPPTVSSKSSRDIILEKTKTLSPGD
jgi:hypothetical protein